jgi:ABC-type multidrug transport system fused ATPase/permease subunit
MEESLIRSIWNALRHRRDLVATLAITLLLSIQSPLGILRVNANAIASLIFQVAGTVVPLALAAAGLSSTFVIKIATEMPEAFEEHKDFPPHRRGQALMRRIKELQEVLEPAWRATAFVLVSFLISALTLLIPPETFSTGVFAIRVSLDTFLASLSLSCILVGTVSFLPMIRYSFRGKVLTNLLRVAQRLREQVPSTLDELLKDARELRSKNREDSDVKIVSKLSDEYQGRSFPLCEKLGLKADDLVGPIEDATSGLAEIKRGIDSRDWQQVCRGVMQKIEQEEAYRKQHGQQSQDTRDAWHDRRRGIETSTQAVMDKWLPDSLKNSSALGKNNK